MQASEIAKRFRVEDGDGFRLSRIDPGDTLGLDIEKIEAKNMLASGIQRLRVLQERLYAEGTQSLLIILQAMDAAGKDGAIQHVMSGINPQGCIVHSFKAPSHTELRHDFLWRTTLPLPERGHIGIFNRSYYEEVLVVRVRPEILNNQMLPPRLIGNDIWKERFEDIRGFERHLSRSGTVLLKFFLHVSKDEQKKRFLERIDQNEKHWKFNARDVSERARWDEYMSAYEDMIQHTATEAAPWHVVPADNKWFSRLVISTAIVDRLEKMDPKFPRIDEAGLKAMQDARAELTSEKKSK